MTAALETTYLGLPLANPLIASSSPITGSVDSLQRLEDSGVGAVVLPSLFEEQVEHEGMELQRLAEFGAWSFPEALSGFHPAIDSYHLAADATMHLLAQAKEALTVPVIASVNGVTPGGWVRYAEQLQNEGADAIELNIFLIPTDPAATAVDVENRYTDLVAAVREQLSIPLAVKIGPYFSSTANMAERLVEAGADALVLFNRFYQPDIDLEEMEVVPNLHLSEADELRLPLRWVAILAGIVDCDLAVTSGVHSAEDALKAVAVGADVAMMASALLRLGPTHVTSVLEGMRIWLDEHGYDSIDQLRGSMSLESAPDAAAFTRANYMDMLVNYTTDVP
jgi:dihydroorotate dehydrogenase (fumarate)